MQGRFAVIGLVRGYCLINILIMHMGAGVTHWASPSHLGFSDSAELFVFLAGVSTWLAHGAKSPRERLSALWRRAGRLYVHNLAVIAGALTLLLLVAGLIGVETMLADELVETLVATPVTTDLWHLLTLQQSVGYSTILRLYILLMLLAPALLWLTSRRWWLALPVTAAVWLFAGQFGVIAHDSLTGAPLNLSVLPWVLVFTCGVAFGAALRKGITAPKSPWLLAGALSLILGYVVLLYVAVWLPEIQTWIVREDTFWLGVSKTLQSPLRVLHLLALVYVFTAYRDAPVLRLVHAAGPDHPLARLGKRSLPVFTVSAIFTVPANELLHQANLRWGAASAPALACELLLVGAGLFLMWAVATKPRTPHARPARTVLNDAAQARAMP